MKILRLPFKITTIFLFTFSVLNAASVKDFKYIASLSGECENNIVNRISLLPDIFGKMEQDNFQDIRLFDYKGTEVPFVICDETPQFASAQTFTGTIENYETRDNIETILVSVPENSSGVNTIRFEMDGKNFNKNIKVESSADKQAWTPVCENQIYDFSQRINLRKTDFVFPVLIRNPWFKITLTPLEKIKDNSSVEFKADQDQLSLQFNSLNSQQSRIEAINFGYAPASLHQPPLDSYVFSNLKIFHDKPDELMLDLESLHLPVAQVEFEIDKPYYHRPVEGTLLFKNRPMDKSYGALYKIPHLPAENNILSFRSAMADQVHFRFTNGDNPPLVVQSVKISWIRKNLLFIPEAGKTYALFFGNPEIKAPEYELNRLLPPLDEAFFFKTALVPSTSLSNPKYQALTPVKVKNYFWKGLLIALLIGLAVALPLWLKRILRDFKKTE